MEPCKRRHETQSACRVSVSTMRGIDAIAHLAAEANHEVRVPEAQVNPSDWLAIDKDQKPVRGNPPLLRNGWLTLPDDQAEITLRELTEFLELRGYHPRRGVRPSAILSQAPTKRENPSEKTRPGNARESLR